MDVEEIYKMKSILESEIQQKMYEFEKTTDVYIQTTNIIRIPLSPLKVVLDVALKNKIMRK